MKSDRLFWGLKNANRNCTLTSLRSERAKQKKKIREAAPGSWRWKPINLPPNYLNCVGRRGSHSKFNWSFAVFSFGRSVPLCGIFWASPFRWQSNLDQRRVEGSTVYALHVLYVWSRHGSSVCLSFWRRSYEESVVASQRSPRRQVARSTHYPSL